MKILVTGADGFVGNNLRQHLLEGGIHEILPVTLGTTEQDLLASIGCADFVIHLAGVNRPKNDSEFVTGNIDFTEMLCANLAKTGRPVPIAFASSTQAVLQNPYGLSKLAAENAVLDYSRTTGSRAYLFRLSNVFGKWSKPNYNSAVATFCYNIARGLPIIVNDAAAPLRLHYIDDVIAAFIGLLNGSPSESGYLDILPRYDTTVGEVVEAIYEFAESRISQVTPPVGTGLLRALYATYLSFLPPELFCYQVKRHCDPRGEFTEMLKTKNSGQFSYFTAGPSVTRGEHYHHTKTEKFLIIRGEANFSFRNMLTSERIDIRLSGGQGQIIESIPGWAHSVTNVGMEELIVGLWANEIFDPQRPDTVSVKVTS